MSPKTTKESAVQHIPQDTVRYRSIDWLLNRPRMLRILIAGVFSAFVTLALFPVVDAMYLDFFFTMETRALPSLVSSAIGLVTYFVGWQLIVGTIGTRPAARMAILWYFGIGVFAIVLAILLVINGIIIINLPT